MYFTVCSNHWCVRSKFSGGLFHPNDVNQENVFKHAIHDVNGNRHILSRSNLSGQIEKVSPQDSFHASKRGKYNILYAYSSKYVTITTRSGRSGFLSRLLSFENHDRCPRSVQYNSIIIPRTPPVQCAVCSDSVSPPSSGRNRPRYPVTSNRSATQWKYPIWKRGGTTSSGAKAAWSTCTRTRPCCLK